MFVPTTDQAGVCAAADWSTRAVQDSGDLGIGVVSELDFVVGGIQPVEGHFDCVAHILPGHKRFGACHWWRTAIQGLLVNDCNVHVFLAVKDALWLVETHIDEVLALHSDLGESIGRSARWLERMHLRRLVVQERQ